MLMLRPIDRSRREGPLYPGSAKILRDFIDPRHLLLQVDANFDFQSLVEFLLNKYNPEVGRPAIHPEVLIRALLLSAIYDVPSYRQLCERISENLAWRWFCHLALEDSVFDHSTLTVFIERIGSEGFQALLGRLNAELLRLGLLSPRMYVDSTAIEAKVRTATLERTDLSPKEFSQQAVQEEGVFTLREKRPAVPEEGWPASLRCLRYQDDKGRLPLSPVDPEARWRRPNKELRAVLGYKENVIADKSGFILARGVTPGTASDPQGAEALVDRLPLHPKSMTGDAGYRAGQFRWFLRRRGITPYIPLNPNQEAEANLALASGFVYHGDHVVCPQGKTLKRAGFQDGDASLQYVALQADCQACPLKATCLSDKEKRKHVKVSRYEYEFRRARQLNRTLRYQREMRRRTTVSEGVFASLDRLAWDEARFWGTEKLDCQGCIAAIAHNILKALRKVRFWKRRAEALLPTHSHLVADLLRTAPLRLLASIISRLHLVRMIPLQA
jgi:transposase